MSRDIKLMLQRLKELIIEEHGIIDFPWCDYLLYPYYLHFNDEDNLIVAGSLVAFYGLLLEWEDGSGMPFYTGTEEYDCHDFERYVIEFMKYYKRNILIAPTTCKVIVEALKNLIERVNLSIEFPIIEIETIDKLTEFVLNEYVVVDHSDYRQSLKEANIYF